MAQLHLPKKRMFSRCKEGTQNLSTGRRAHIQPEIKEAFVDGKDLEDGRKMAWRWVMAGYQGTLRSSNQPRQVCKAEAEGEIWASLCTMVSSKWKTLAL